MHPTIIKAVANELIADRTHARQATRPQRRRRRLGTWLALALAAR